MKTTRKQWLRIVQETYPQVLKPIARQIQIEKAVARKRGQVPPAPVKPA